MCVCRSSLLDCSEVISGGLCSLAVSSDSTCWTQSKHQDMGHKKKMMDVIDDDYDDEDLDLLEQ